MNDLTRSTREKALYTLALACLIISFAVRGVLALERYTNSSAYDQRSYLGLGLNIRDGRDLSDGKRHPLLPAILSLIAERDWPYYTRAKFINLGTGVICILLVYELGRRWFGRPVGVLAAGLFSLNPPFMHVASHVMAEPSLTALTLVSWYCMTRALTAPETQRLRWAIAAGAAAGLAYLTKGTALQMVPAFGLVALWAYRGKVWRRKELWLFGVAWLLAWLPLFVFNIGEFGNPLYNYNYKHEIFLDSPTQRHFADLSEAPTLQTYLRTHTAADMAYRLWFGLREVTRILFGALWPGQSEALRGTPWEWGWIAIWLALAGYLIAKRKALARLVFLPTAFALLLAQLVLSMIPLGWFVQASNVGPRFIVVYHPMIYLLAIGSVGEMHRVWRQRQPAARFGQTLSRWAAPTLLTMLVACAGVGAAQAWPQIKPDPVALDRADNARGQAVLEWLAQSTPYGAKVLWGPSYTLPNWIYERRLSLKDVPSKSQTLADVVEYARDKDLVYALLDWEMLDRRREAFSGYFSYKYPYVIIERLPEQWALVLPYDGIPANWCVLRMTDATPLQHEASASVGELARLEGYELYPEEAQPGQTVYLTLYWRAVGDAGADYTAFVHLLDGAGQIVAQSDHQPIEGRYPTSQWRAGELIGDRHALALPANLAAGQYQFVAGYYSLETGQRLPILTMTGVHPDGEGAIALDAPLRVAP